MAAVSRRLPRHPARRLCAALGGLDAAHLAVAYNDVDLCLRVRERGLRVLWTPFAELFHLESASRPSDLASAQRDRYRREIAHMHRRWGAALQTDPFYGPNFSLRDGHAFLAAPRRRRPSDDAPALTRANSGAGAAALAGS